MRGQKQGQPWALHPQCLRWSRRNWSKPGPTLRGPAGAGGDWSRHGSPLPCPVGTSTVLISLIKSVCAAVCLPVPCLFGKKKLEQWNLKSFILTASQDHTAVQGSQVDSTGLGPSLLSGYSEH